jgi:hypothetical protein
MLDINANQPAVFVKIKHNAICNLIAVFAWVFVQVDVQRSFLDHRRVSWLESPVGERVVKGSTVFQGHRPQIPAQLRNEYPVADSLVLGLDFLAHGVVQRFFAPFEAKV